MAVDAKQVRDLRVAIGASVMACKQALEATRGDFVKAQHWLAARAKTVADQKQTRQTRVGIVESYLHSNSRVGVLVELFCETDFVARNSQFKTLAHDLALHIAALKPAYASREHIPPAFIKEHEQLFLEEAAKEKKPAPMQAKIAAGKLAKFLNDQTLLSQPFVKDPTKTVQDVISEATAALGEKIAVGRFARLEI